MANKIGIDLTSSGGGRGVNTVDLTSNGGGRGSHSIDIDLTLPFYSDLLKEIQKEKALENVLINNSKGTLTGADVQNILYPVQALTGNTKVDAANLVSARNAISPILQTNALNNLGSTIQQPASSNLPLNNPFPDGLPSNTGVNVIDSINPYLAAPEVASLPRPDESGLAEAVQKYATSGGGAGTVQSYKDVLDNIDPDTLVKSFDSIPGVSKAQAKSAAEEAIKDIQATLTALEKPIYEEAIEPVKASLRSIDDLAGLYGITYDYDTIYKLLNNSVEKQYDAIYAKQRQSEDKYYDNVTAAQASILDALARDRSAAVQTGVSKGMQAANQLGAMLGITNQFADEATALAQERYNTAQQYGADLANAMVTAESTSNERRNALLDVAKQLYGYDAEQYVADVDKYNTIKTNNAALQQAYNTALGNINSNLAYSYGTMYAAEQNAQAQQYAAQLAALAQENQARLNYAAQQDYNKAYLAANQPVVLTAADEVKTK